MSSVGAQVEPHEKMRARDVNKVARGEQAPKPPHQYGHIDKTPSPPIHNKYPHQINNKENEEEGWVEAGTAPADVRFPTTNQTRHCYTRYLEYHKCIKEKGKDATECEKFAKYYRSFCPDEWVRN
ncbi:putative cytochrome c oxidase subunit 6b-like isoform X1 [Jatropha curcas]|uniref:putative cytochrome c oxidase subunit 6b-like isoform X1 n=1 Tax=Jatropha curcas TaxID=180498 RepID=UPI0009D6DC34|nr:putative cytochrome c oxidase subunit 6b-like isoform X1 [Jatropha curcas]